MDYHSVAKELSAAAQAVDIIFQSYVVLWRYAAITVILYSFKYSFLLFRVVSLFFSVLKGTEMEVN